MAKKHSLRGNINFKRSRTIGPYTRARQKSTGWIHDVGGTWQTTVDECDVQVVVDLEQFFSFMAQRAAASSAGKSTFQDGIAVATVISRRQISVESRPLPIDPGYEPVEAAK